MRRVLIGSLLAAPAWAAPPAADVAIKQREAAAPVVAVTVDWAAARAAAAPGLPEKLRPAVDAIALPVLLPRDAALLAGARVVAGPGWYAASMDAGGAQVTLHAFGRAHLRPDLLAEQKAAGFGTGAPRISRTEGIVSLAFERFGVAYTLDVECQAPLTDPRCTDGLFIMGVLDDLAVLGGRP
ncbi:MAG: hypothetical protein R3F60_21480 [bacterium]